MGSVIKSERGKGIYNNEETHSICNKADSPSNRGGCNVALSSGGTQEAMGEKRVSFSLVLGTGRAGYLNRPKI